MLFLVSGYCLFFGGLLLVVSRRRIRDGQLRAPMEFKLLRGPGESLRRRLAKFGEEFAFRMLAVVLASLFAPMLVLWLYLLMVPPSQTLFWIGVLIAALIFVAGFIAALQWTTHHLRRYQNDRLGYLGEREVAEQLQILCRRGYHIFHDVPAERRRGRFNIDHVTVGPAGVAIVETKTRRKGRARTGRKDFVVSSDGRRLIWPWGEEGVHLKQTASRAGWVREWIRERTGVDTPVKPILALPGWFVEATGRGAVAVVNPKLLPAEVERGGESGSELTVEQIDQIARQFDERCRDVAD
jgi:hypothetical protein